MSHKSDTIDDNFFTIYGFTHKCREFYSTVLVRTAFY